MKVGYHIGGVSDLLAVANANLPLAPCYQIDVGNMSTMQFSMPDFDKTIVKDSDIVLHGPFINSFLTSKSGYWRQSLDYLCRTTDYALRNKIRYLVFHPGGIADGQSVEDGKDKLQKLLREWGNRYQTSEVIFCLENKAGGPKDICTCSIIKEVLERELDLVNVAMCLDTQHSWASGELKDVVASWDVYKELVRVLHLNSVPKGNVYGGRKDSHSSTLLRESDEASMDYLKFFMSGNVNERTPVILERNIELVPDDVLFIEEVDLPWYTN